MPWQDYAGVQHSDPQDTGSSIQRLFGNLMAIQERKRQNAIQDEVMRMKQQEFQREQEQKDIEKQTNLLALAQSLAALKSGTEAPEKKVETPEIGTPTGAEVAPNVFESDFPVSERTDLDAEGLPTTPAGMPASIPLAPKQTYTQPAVPAERQSFRLRIPGLEPADVMLKNKEEVEADRMKKLEEAGVMAGHLVKLPDGSVIPASLATAMERNEGKTTKPPAIGSIEDYLARKYPGVPREQYTPKQVEEAKKALAEAGHITVNTGMSSLYGQVDPEAIAEGIRSGTMPPDIAQYGRVASGAIASKLAKSGYNHAQALTDWKATQKYFASANSTQQLRLRQAAQTAYGSLDVIDQLADQWKALKFPGQKLVPLNRASLAMAKQGLYGEQAAEAARQLEGQITDVVSELGQVYMGGGTPTDRALELAKKNLSADWSDATLKKMTDLARTNLRIRLNSIDTIGVVGTSATNPYAGTHATSGTETGEPKGGQPTGKDPKRLIKYQGKMVPFDSLSPELQARVVAAGG